MKLNIVEYVSIEKQFYLDAEKYLKRAQVYWSENKFGHAAGCLAKAAKKIHKAEQFKPFKLDDCFGSIQISMGVLSKQIEESILNGT